MTVPDHLRATFDLDSQEPVPGLRIKNLAIDSLDEIFSLNESIFGEERIINTFDRRDLLLLLASIDDEPVGFKVGYRENRFVYYSAKGGVLPSYRRQGIALSLMDEMIVQAREMGYARLAFDTFPNLHPGMTVLAIKDGFRLMKADYNATYREYRLRFEKRIAALSENRKHRV